MMGSRHLRASSYTIAANTQELAWILHALKVDVVVGENADTKVAVLISHALEQKWNRKVTLT